MSGRFLLQCSIEGASKPVAVPKHRLGSRIGSLVSTILRAFGDALQPRRAHVANSSSNALASFRSSVSKPSVNQP